MTFTLRTSTGQESAVVGPLRIGRAHPYDLPMTLSGTIDKASGTGKGTWTAGVSGGLPTVGDWSAGR